MLRPDGSVSSPTHDAGPRDAGVPFAGFGGVTGAGIGGSFPSFAGFGGGSAGFPGLADGGMCFDCGGGCLDCGHGCDCSPQINAGNAPAWQPPFAAVGSAGWRDSPGPFCGGLQETWNIDVWSDASGVYVGLTGLGLAAPDNAPEDDAGVAMPSVLPGTIPQGIPGTGGFSGADGVPMMGEFTARTRVWHNDGSGWALRVDGVGGSQAFGITTAGAHVVLYSNPLPEEVACRLGMTTRGGFMCLDVDPVQDVVAVNRSAFALMGGTRLLQFDGTSWRSSTTLLPYPATRLWADESTMIAVGTAGTVLKLQGDGWQLQDPGVLEGLTAVWGQSGDDVWVGTASGKLLHYDGNAWTQVAQLGGKTCGARPPVVGIWGDGGAVYVHTATELDRWRDGKLETLGNWTCGIANTQQVRGVAGQSADDLFIVLIDQSFGSPCGTTFVAHFDGKQFHRM